MVISSPITVFGYVDTDDSSDFCGRCQARSEDLTDFVWSRECRAILRCL
jgi:hypothetical protein